MSNHSAENRDAVLVNMLQPTCDGFDYFSTFSK